MDLIDDGMTELDLGKTYQSARESLRAYGPSGEKLVDAVDAYDQGPKDSAEQFLGAIILLKDTGSNDPGGLLNVPGDYKRHMLNHTVDHALGYLEFGSGSVISFNKTSSFWKVRSGGLLERRLYKATANHGSLKLKKVNFFKKAASVFTSFGIPLFSVGFNISEDICGNPSKFASSIIHDGTEEQIDWLISMISTGDIRISDASPVKCISPLIPSNAEGSLILTQTLPARYLSGKLVVTNTNRPLEEIDGEGLTNLYWVISPKLTTVMRLKVEADSPSDCMVRVFEPSWLIRAEAVKVEFKKDFAGRLTS